MDTATYLSLINAQGVAFHSVEWQTEVRPAAAYREHTLRKVTTAMVMTGASYADMAVNGDRETGELPWGTWSEFPYVITHKGQTYFRLYTVENTVRTTYLVDGDVVRRSEFLAYLTPSQRNGKAPHAGCVTIKAENIRLIGQPGLVPA